VKPHKPVKTAEYRNEKLYNYRGHRVVVLRRQRGDGVYKRRESWNAVYIDGEIMSAGGIRDACKIIDRKQNANA